METAVIFALEAPTDLYALLKALKTAVTIKEIIATSIRTSIKVKALDLVFGTKKRCFDNFEI